MSVFFRMRRMFYNDRYRELSWWRKAWVRVWSWVESPVWKKWLKPHVRPRRWYRRRRDFWRDQALPQDINAFIWGSEEEGYCIQLIERNGPWQLVVSGWTEEEAREHADEVLGWFKREAGVRHPGESYTVWWYERKPTAADLAYTR